MKVMPAPRLQDLLRQAMPVKRPLLMYISPEERCEMLLAALYIIWTIVCSAIYLYVINPSLTNNYGWAGFNTSHRVYIADLMNMLQLENITKLSAPLDIRLINVIPKTPKSYYRANTQIDVPPALRRLQLLSPLPLPRVIAMLRKSTLDQALSIPTSFCWVDFDKHFEIAHTSRRQERCYQQYYSNAAVYIESVMRNTIDPFRSQAFHMLNETLLQPMATFYKGEQLYLRMESHQWTSVSSEIEYWVDYGIDSWQVQVQNQYHYGFINIIKIRNAFNVDYEMTIDLAPFRTRSDISWSSSRKFNGLRQDLLTCQELGCSVLRASNITTLFKLGLTWDSVYFGSDSTPTSRIVRDAIGPLDSIDVTLVPPSNSLVHYFTLFQTALYTILEDANFTVANYCNAYEPIFVTPLPPTWQNYTPLYFGGNLLCSKDAPTSYPQPLFDIDDQCFNQDKEGFLLEMSSVLFAIHSTEVSVTSICELDQATAPSCLKSLLFIHPIYELLEFSHTNLSEVLTEISDIDISYVQMVQLQNATETLLVQPLLSKAEWSFFGWIAIYEWLRGLREVYTFEGDNGRIDVISHRMEFQQVPSNPLETPFMVNTLAWYLCLYTTSILGIVAVALGVQSLLQSPIPIPTTNMLNFNRVAGSVWVGKSLLVCRSLFAMGYLSTASVALRTSLGGITQLHHEPYTIFIIVLVSGEATWLVYVVQELASPVTTLHRAAPVGSAIAWVLVAFLTWISPWSYSNWQLPSYRCVSPVYLWPFWYCKFLITTFTGGGGIDR
ncbi:hypothetical protein THRCLA_21371 [Thraustotheca clavata]|uniref:Transmembrane protein n=1 Tax=Thraustotheca clavata TaxID=74557 RepID=A0A1V9ZX82_9STRA|nr:hypothetical protein THRCLA_21371 [Thraustotheca clavata]